MKGLGVHDVLNCSENSQARIDNGVITSQSLKDITSWIPDINPNYHNPFVPDSVAYHENCGSCAWAVEQRLSGKNVTAVASKNNIGTDREMEKTTGKKCTYMPLKEIEAYLCAIGPGAHLIVGINRFPSAFGMPQPGHWFNAYYDGKDIHTIDGQSGQVLDWPYDFGDVSEWCALI